MEDATAFFWYDRLYGRYGHISHSFYCHEQFCSILSQFISIPKSIFFVQW